MPDVPALRPQRIIRALERCGLTVKRQTGSHVILTKPGLRRPVPVAMHAGELPPAYVRDIIAQAELTVEEFLNAL
jgi:predicted RNA binding protein YcfA (HicA-like mRNA interferase family)